MPPPPLPEAPPIEYGPGFFASPTLSPVYLPLRRCFADCIRVNAAIPPLTATVPALLISSFSVNALVLLLLVVSCPLLYFPSILAYLSLASEASCCANCSSIVFQPISCGFTFFAPPHFTAMLNSSSAAGSSFLSASMLSQRIWTQLYAPPLPSPIPPLFSISP